MLELLRDFWEVHKQSLPSENYSKLISGIQSILPTSDSMVELLTVADKSVDGVFQMAEGSGDDWILDVLKCYPGNFNANDIKAMRNSIKSGGGDTTRKTRLL